MHRSIDSSSFLEGIHKVFPTKFSTGRRSAYAGTTGSVPAWGCFLRCIRLDPFQLRSGFDSWRGLGRMRTKDTRYTPREEGQDSEK